ncbi:LuxR C-terminal-related transcriptional regulator [Enterobacter sp. UPMP2060]
MSSILVLSDDFIFKKAITLLLTAEKEELAQVEKGSEVINIFYSNHQENIEHVLIVNNCSALIVDIQDELCAQTISVLSGIKREYPKIRMMFIVNEFFDYQNPFARVLISILDMLVTRYESIIGIKQKLNRFSRSKHFMFNGSESAFSGLSKREQEVINRLVQGKNTNEIAEELYISTKTVYTHRYRVYAKLGVRNIFELHKVMRNSLMLPSP